jgi:hypothetical protein
MSVHIPVRLRARNQEKNFIREADSGTHTGVYMKKTSRLGIYHGLHMCTAQAENIHIIFGKLISKTI